MDHHPPTIANILAWFSNRSPWLYLIPLLLLNMLLSYPYLTTPMIAETDAYVRALQAEQASTQHDFWFIDFGSSWLPFHILILRLGLLLYQDPLRSGRWITFILSSCSIPLFYFYIRRFFREPVALFSTIVFTVLPLRFILATQTLSEGIFLPLFLLILMLSGSRRITVINTIGMLLASAIASGIRYEGWFLLPYIWVYLWTRIRSWKFRLLTTLITLAVPLWWTIMSYLQTGTIWTYAWKKIHIAQTSGVHPEYFNPYLSLQKITPIFLDVVPLPFFILACIALLSLLSFIIQKRTFLVQRSTAPVLLRFQLLLPLYFFTLTYLQVFFGTMEWTPQRYFLLPTVLLLPFLVIGILMISTKQRIIGIIVVCVLYVLIPSYFTAESKNLTTRAFTEYPGTTILPDFWNLVAYLQTTPSVQYQYIRSPQLEDTFFAAIAYFSRHPEIPSDTFTPENGALHGKNLYRLHIIVEKPIPEILRLQSDIVYQNDTFAVVYNATSQKQ